MIYRVIRKLKAVLYHAIVGPDIKHSFAECGKDSHIESGGDFFPLSNIHIGNHASIGVNARFWTTRAQIYKDVAPYTIVGGAPAHFIKNRFSEDQLERHIQTTEGDDSPFFGFGERR